MAVKSNEITQELKKVIERLNASFKTEIEVRKPKRLWVTVDPTTIVQCCEAAHENGFSHLSTISAVDWLDESKIELAYHLWSYTHKCLLTIKTKVDRDNPIIDSVNSIWGTNAETCERECHEMFGVKFKGNNNLTPLFLEDWQGPPPFLKDFDWREYVKKEFYRKDDPREKPYFEVRK